MAANLAVEEGGQHPYDELHGPLRPVALQVLQAALPPGSPHFRLRCAGRSPRRSAVRRPQVSQRRLPRSFQRGGRGGGVVRQVLGEALHQHLRVPVQLPGQPSPPAAARSRRLLQTAPKSRSV